MASRDAAQLILEVDARIATAQRAVNQLARSIQQDADKMGQSFKGVEQAQARVGKAMQGMSGNVRSGFTQLSFQIGDVTQGLAMGTRASTIFAQQSGQVIQALQLMGGEGSKFLRFLGGPWGIAISTAVVILSTLVPKLFDSRDAVGGLVEKMREQARQAGLNKQADEAWKNTIEGLTESIRKRREEQEKSLQTDIQAEEASLDQARSEAARLKSLIDRLKDQLVDATIARDKLSGQGAGTHLAGASAGALTAAENRIKDIRRKIAEAERLITEQEATIRGAQVPIAERNVEARVDKVKAATDAYTRTLGELRKALQAGNVSQAEFERRLEAAKRKLDAVKESAKKTSDQTAKIAFTSPAPGARQTSGFGVRTDPFTGERKFHGGVDLAGGPGRINAPAGGLVIRTGTVSGFGNVVWIDHGNGIISELNHLKQQSVKVGDVVETGQQVGVMGSTGRSTGVHLDWRVRTGANAAGVGGKYVDPTKGKFAVEPGSAVARAEALAVKAAEDALNRRQAFEAELAKLEADILRAKGDLLRGDEAQADFAIEQLQLEQASYEKALDRQVADGKLEASDAEALKLKQAQLTYERAKAVELGRQLSQMERQSEAEQREFEYRLEETRFADEMAGTQAEHRALQLEILDIIYQQKEAALRDLKARHELAGEIEKAALVQGQIDRLPLEKSRDTTRTLQGTMSPLEAWAKTVPQTEAEITEAFQGILVNGIDPLASALTDVIMGTKSLGEAFSDIARSIIADIIQMTIRMLIFKAISGILGGSGTGGLGGTYQFARGGVFSGGNVIPFARGGVVHQPTLFPMANGMGLMGEAGPEAVMPLARDSMGRLGVRAAAANDARNGPIEVLVSVAASPDLMVKAAVVADARIRAHEPGMIRKAANVTLRAAARPKLMGR